MIFKNQHINFLRRSFSKFHTKDTIYALSTGFGKSAIAIIRVSGDSAHQSLQLTQKKMFKNLALEENNHKI